MNKQQLANKIWASANKLRSKIEANEYKDYILGFIFYKFLSDQEEKFLRNNKFTDDLIKAIEEPKTKEDPNYLTMEFCQKNLGYFITYKQFFSTWVSPNTDNEEPFTVGTVRDGLSAFSRNIYPTHKKVFEGIFQTLQEGLSKLGDSVQAQTKAVNNLLQLIKDIPTDGSQDYDVLGFIYEYLISNFAANAGKKAGEFYTPHEVALLMAEIVAFHLKGKDKIEIYDPTSGSGSLLLNIGRATAKHIADKDQIKYYAQELKQNTYNLTRMNLVMRGIKPYNIVTRCGDSLELDWPLFEESDPTSTYHFLQVDAVVSNPPYSQEWDPKDKDQDPRFNNFGLAPKGTADYAFLLHALYHVKHDGIMTIVLPHGVLFRGGEEERIRKNLIENNHIDAIIGLPANIFFGTGIPTIVMVLRQKRQNTDTLFIDASRCFEKVGKNNKLRASDIRKIADAYMERCPHDNTFAALVSRDTIRENGYNLNIPRYIQPAERPEKWDIYATVFGGIPKEEIDDLQEYWEAFPSLREELFGPENQPYSQRKEKYSIGEITENKDVKALEEHFYKVTESIPVFLKKELIENMENLIIAREEAVITQELFRIVEPTPIVDKYMAYEMLDKRWADREADNRDIWTNIATDLEIIQTEGKEAIRQVDPFYVTKKDSDGNEYEEQDGYTGHILPFRLVASMLLSEDFLAVMKKNEEVRNLTEAFDDLPNKFDELELKTDIWNDEKSEFIAKGIKARVAKILQEVSSPEIDALTAYIQLLDERAKKPEKLAFIAAHREVKWNEMEANKDGTFGKSNVNKYIVSLQMQYVFPEESLETRILEVNRITEELKQAKKDAKQMESALEAKTIELMPSITEEQIEKLLYEKWIRPLYVDITHMPINVTTELASKVDALTANYADTLQHIEQEKAEAQNTLASLMDNLTGNDFDMQGLKSLQKMLRGE